MRVRARSSSGNPSPMRRSNINSIPGWKSIAAMAWVALVLPLSRAAPAEPDKPKLVVLDIELTGDQGGPQFAAEHAARLKKESDILRQQLASSGLFQVVDTTPA